jgi:hypothetical protein
MEINFSTENIDEKKYERLILHYIYEHYHYTDHDRLQRQDQWKINIKRTDQYNTKFYNNDPRLAELDFTIPHGVTGNFTIDCYITDSTNNMITLQNMSVICHELAHMILNVYYSDRIIEMRYADFHGKKGDKRKFFSCEVHDRVTEGRVKQFRYRLTRYIGVDISDLTNSRKLRRY